VTEKPRVPTPKASGKDIAHAAGRAVLSAIPFAGGAAVEVFQHVIQPPLEKRRIEWMNDVGERLNKLEDEGVKLESLSDNEQFVSAVMSASQVAIRTHQAEKLEALRNAVENVARGQAPDEALQHLFFGFVDTLVPLQIQMLKLFQAPPLMDGISMGGLSLVLERSIPSLRGHRDIYDQFWRDLYARGLVNTDGLHTTMSGNGLSQKRTTSLGDQFLRFITRPA
jgi:hypothetical protein